MADDSFHCWHCGKTLEGIPFPLGRREECPDCASSLHVCRMCGFYDRKVGKDCRETMADEVTEKEAANFCDYFRPRAGLTAGEDRAAAESRAKLAQLFGNGDGLAGAAPAEDRKDGGQEDNNDSGDPEAGESRRRLESLFGNSKD